jgi:hypothetical protein
MPQERNGRETASFNGQPDRLCLKFIMVGRQCREPTGSRKFVEVYLQRIKPLSHSLSSSFACKDSLIPRAASTEKSFRNEPNFVLHDNPGGGTQRRDLFMLPPSKSIHDDCILNRLTKTKSAVHSIQCVPRGQSAIPARVILMPPRFTRLTTP